MPQLAPCPGRSRAVSAAAKAVWDSNRGSDSNTRRSAAPIASCAMPTGSQATAPSRDPPPRRVLPFLRPAPVPASPPVPWGGGRRNSGPRWVGVSSCEGSEAAVARDRVHDRGDRRPAVAGRHEPAERRSRRKRVRGLSARRCEKRAVTATVAARRETQRDSRTRLCGWEGQEVPRARPPRRARSRAAGACRTSPCSRRTRPGSPRPTTQTTPSPTSPVEIARPQRVDPLLLLLPCCAREAPGRRRPPRPPPLPRRPPRLARPGRCRGPHPQVDGRPKDRKHKV